ncbi:MAG: PQQ-binding-like beta-propeller repeat protein [Verrucomicrobiota bacterium]
MTCFRYGLLLAAVSLASTLRATDWPHFLGPNHDLHSSETGVNFNYGPEGPPILWEIERGKGHSGPVISDGKLVFIHQVDKKEEVQCLNAETGEEIWKHSYSVDVAQSYGITDTPRSSPVIDPETGLVYTLGNDGDLICFRLEDGEIVWEIELEKEFGPAPFFFGYGSCPLVYGETLIVQAGAEEATVVALNKKTGETIWAADHEWNGSYASPIIMPVNGEDRLLVFAGGMVKPPHGGLLLINPTDGTIEDAFPWRSENYASVNAATPVPSGPNRVFISEDYGKGGIMLEYDAANRARIRWQSPEFGCQFQTPIYHEGIIYGFGGNGGLMLAFDALTGRMLWNEAFYQTTIPWDGRDIPISLGHAHLIHVDGQFLCLSENGALIQMQLDASGYRLGSMARLFYAPETWAPPALSNGLLYINQNELGTRLICYDLRSPAEEN